MSVQTEYDDMRDELSNKLEECLKMAEKLVLSDDVWGYKDMRTGYAMDVYLAVEKAKDIV